MNLHDGALVSIFWESDPVRSRPPAGGGERSKEQGHGPRDPPAALVRTGPPGAFGRTERGASVVEYGLLVALIAVVCIVAVSLLGQNASKRFSQVGSAIQ